MMNIVKEIGEAAVLEQLAEEASELAQAALKLARIIRGENPTPVAKEEAMANLVEEWTDVDNCGFEFVIGTGRALYDVDLACNKRARWEKRIKEAKENGSSRRAGE